MKNMTLLTDAELVVLFQTSNSSLAFGELYNHYQNKVFKYCLKITSNRDMAFDITQDAFVKIADKIGNLKDANLFANWVFRIARNMCFDALNQSKKHQFSDIDDQISIADEVTDDTRIEFEATLEGMGDAINALKAEDRALIEDKYFENQSVEELMVAHKLSKSAVKMRLMRSRQKMKAALKRG